MSRDEIIEQIKQECDENEIDLLSLGVETENDLINYALNFLLSNLDYIEEVYDEVIDAEFEDVDDEEMVYEIA